MSDSDNGKDCKHEIDYFTCEDIDGRIHVEFGCANKECDTLKKEDIVIHTKAYDQAREDVITDVKAEKDKYNEWIGMEWEGEIDQAFLIFSDKKKDVYKEFRVLEKKANEALDALGGE